MVPGPLVTVTTATHHGPGQGVTGRSVAFGRRCGVALVLTRVGRVVRRVGVVQGHGGMVLAH